MLLYFFQKEFKGKLLRMDLSKALGHNRFFENRCIKLGCLIMFIVMSVKKFHVPYKAGCPLKTELDRGANLATLTRYVVETLIQTYHSVLPL